MLKPKLLTTLKGYSREQFTADATAGVIVGIVALPLCIAFAIASGLTPERGLVTGIVAGLVISLLGGSRVQIGGPAGAFIIIVAGIVEQYGVAGLITATLMAGVLLAAMGFAGLGSIIKFVPQPVITGFTSGIAVIIFASQIPDFLGLTLPDLPSDFIDRWSRVLPEMRHFNPYALALAAGTIVLLINWPKISRRIPGTLVALVACTLVARLFDLPVETIGERFGELPSALPAPLLPDLSLDVIRNLVQPALAIALLGAIESLLSAIVADGMIGARHRSNMELVAQGAANFFSATFGGMPATGAIARTATNVRNGGRTPMAGIVHALTLLVITLFFAPLASKIPLACLAAILVFVAIHMFEWHSFSAILRSPRGDMAVMLATFGLTVVVDLVVAIEAGMVMAAFLFMKHMAEVTNIQVIKAEFSDVEESGDLLPKLDIPAGVEIFEINGPFFFGAVYKFKEAMSIVEKSPRARIIRMEKVNAIDGSALRALEEVWRDCTKHHSAFIISGIHAQPYITLTKSGLLDKFGAENVLQNFDDALSRAKEFLANKS